VSALAHDLVGIVGFAQKIRNITADWTEPAGDSAIHAFSSEKSFG
jgi:hypothetical protein